METNQTAARAARRFLDERVRNDWDWPNVPEAWSASDEEVRGITEFRERYYGDSDSQESEDEVNPYQFDTPDSIGDAVERKNQRRRRKQREELEEQMKENEGLRCFVERRDVWTGVASVRKYGKPASKDAAPGPGPGEHAFTSDEATSAPGEPLAEAEPLMPVAPRILVDNSIRASIAPKAYSDIYQKIVVSSRTPTVPVNLADMTKILVQGWKDNGEWPPKAAPLDPLAGRKRSIVGVNGVAHGGEFLSHHPHMKKGMDSVKRILHLNGHHGQDEGAAHEHAK